MLLTEEIPKIADLKRELIADTYLKHQIPTDYGNTMVLKKKYIEHRGLLCLNNLPPASWTCELSGNFLALLGQSFRLDTGYFCPTDKLHSLDTASFIFLLLFLFIRPEVFCEHKTDAFSSNEERNIKTCALTSEHLQVVQSWMQLFPVLCLSRPNVGKLVISLCWSVK